MNQNEYYGDSVQLAHPISSASQSSSMPTSKFEGPEVNWQHRGLTEFDRSMCYLMMTPTIRQRRIGNPGPCSILLMEWKLWNQTRFLTTLIDVKPLNLAP
jgi:hypothetical protein